MQRSTFLLKLSSKCLVSARTLVLVICYQHNVILAPIVYSATAITRATLDKIDQSDYRKITILPEKFSCQW